jgi:hypothetical protein
METQSAYHIPNGPKNMAAIFPSISWKDVEEYYIEVMNLESVVIATTCRNVIGAVSPAEDETVRLHFLNSLGGIDAVNFCSTEESYETKSDSSQVPLSYPLLKSEGGYSRSNIQANETYKVSTTLYTEKEMKWLKELISSPAVWLEWKGTQGQPDDYLPVLLEDAKVITLKPEDRYVYELTLEFKLSNADITIRN